MKSVADANAEGVTVVDVPLLHQYERHCATTSSSGDDLLSQHSVSSQRMAICDDCGVVAVANGPIVDLFLASGLVLMSSGNAHSDDDDDQDADDAKGDRGRSSGVTVERVEQLCDFPVERAVQRPSGVRGGAASCSRSGILLRDNPLESIYPAISALREDPVRQIYIRKNQVLSISNTAGRFWELQSTSSSDESKRVVWPTIKEFWESPAIHFVVQLEIEGVCAVSPGGKLGTALSATLFAREAENENSERWIVALMTGQSLQFISRQALSEAAKVSCINSRAGEQTESNEIIPPADVSGIDELETSPQQIDRRDEKRAHDKTPVATTIQEKYRLPRTTWDVNLRPPPEKESGEPRAETARTGFNEVNIAQLTKVTPAAYDQRVVETARRIEQLSSTLKQLRTSFQSFTQDAQQHRMQ
ncbi:hypothetical protein FI667_g14784, partial [Globisporangium splendens]